MSDPYREGKPVPAIDAIDIPGSERGRWALPVLVVVLFVIVYFTTR